MVARVATHRDEAAFKALFETFAPKLKAYLLRQGLQNASAEELAQETLLSVWRKAALFDPGRASAAAWIFTLARNLRIDAYRHARTVAAGELDPIGDQDGPPTPAGLLLTAEREGRVRDALGSLPPDQVQVIRSSFYQDKPHSEIARDLDLPLGTVKSRIRTALIRLRSVLGDAR